MAVAITQTANPAGVAASSTIATYTAASIGTAASDRIVVVVVGTELAAANPSACTIDGTAMTAASGGDFAAVQTQIFYKFWPTGTTADIAVTYSATSPGAAANHIAVYSVTGATDTLNSSGNDGSSDMDATDPLTTGSITIPTNGGFIAVAAGAADTVAKTWANATEDIDDDAGTFRFTTATRTTALTTTAVTCTGGTNGEDGALSYIILDSGIPQTPPTVALNTPADTGTTSDTTPDLAFTGTDVNANDIEYNIQIDTANTFDAQTGSGPTYDTVVTANGNGTNSGAFGALTTAEANEVLICTLDFSNTTPSGVTFDGTLTWTQLGSAISKPNVAGKVFHYWALAASVQSAVTFTATFTGGGFPQWSGTIMAWKGCDPSSPIGDHQTGTANNTTAVSATVTTTRANSRVVAGTGQTGSNAMSPGSGETEATEVASAGGFSTSNATYQTSITSSSSTSVTMDVTIGINDDMGMRAIELKATQTPLIDKVSSSDTGFTDITNGADTHPFATGDQIQYAVQSALSIGTTYYWRVRGIDPTGSNTYGAWSTTRSFSVVAALLSKGIKILQAIKRASFY